MPLDPSYEAIALNWLLRGGAGAPPGRWVSLATGTPTASGASDGAFTPRCTVTFAAANSPQGSVTNLNAISGTNILASATAVGWNLYDSSVSGTRIAFGTLSAAFGVRTAGSTVGFIVGGLKTTLA